MICFVVLLVCFLALGGGVNLLGHFWAITFTKDGIFKSCTNEMNILWYNLYKSSLVFVGNSETCLF